MKGVAFFPGRFRVDELGAVSVVTRNLFPEENGQLEGTIIGMGKFAQGPNLRAEFRQIDILPQYLQRSISYRAISKIGRVCGPESLSRKIDAWTGAKLSVAADKLAAEQLTRLLRDDCNIGVAVGYVGESLHYGKAAKAAGRRYAVHSQFCHPNVQNTLVADAFRSLGLSPPPISQSRLQRQLATLELADLIWCPSEFSRQSLIENGIPQEKTFVCYLGVDVARFQVAPEQRRCDGSFVILFVGNVGVQKGVHVLLEALAQSHISNATMVFNGSADTTAQGLLHKYHDRLAAKAITVRVDPGDPRRYHKAASVFVLPSIHDSYGIVVPEAMAAGLPVIVSDHVGAREILEPGKNGFVFRSGNAQELAKRLEFFHQDSASRDAYGRASSVLARKFDTEKSAQELTNLLQNHNPCFDGAQGVPQGHQSRPVAWTDSAQSSHHNHEIS